MTENRVLANTQPRVRIPLSPPKSPERLDFIRFFGTSAFWEQLSDKCFYSTKPDEFKENVTLVTLIYRNNINSY